LAGVYAVVVGAAVVVGSGTVVLGATLVEVVVVAPVVLATATVVTGSSADEVLAVWLPPPHAVAAPASARSASRPARWFPDNNIDPCI
jgi:hypothetical protein